MAAAAVATDHGLHVAEPVVLADAFNVVAWLQPTPVVARIIGIPALLRSTMDEIIGREIRVANFLVEQGVRAVRPSAELPPGPHRRDGLWLSFWEHVQIEDGRPSSAVAGGLLRDLHSVLADYHEDSPSLEVPIGDLEALLTGNLKPAELSSEDITLIRYRSKNCARD